MMNSYQMAARHSAILPCDCDICYLALALCGEAGEVAEKVKKTIRDKDGKFSKEMKEAIALELGDVLWYLANIAYTCGYSLSEVANMNIEKVNSRLQRNLIHGSGDNR